MKLLLAFLAALALAFGPLVALAAVGGCDAGGGPSMVMPAGGQPTSKPEDPCCRHDKACAAVCALAGQAVATLPSGGGATQPSHVMSRRLARAELQPPSAPSVTDPPPPRTRA